MKSVMTKDFSRVAKTEITRSTFDRSHGLKTAFDSGYLVPVELQEVYPSDEIEFNGKFLARLAPVVTPVLDNVFLDLHAFFVPHRLVWNNFTKLMGERKNPNDSIDYLVPQVLLSKGYSPELVKIGSLADFLGLPVQNLKTKDEAGTEHHPSWLVSVLPFRGYQKIWDDWFRDENLQDSIIQDSSELGEETVSTRDKMCKLRKRGKRHDYFTSCLPWTQRGDGVNMPLGAIAPVRGNGMTLGLTDGTNNFGLSTGRSDGESNRTIFRGVYGSEVGTAQNDGETLNSLASVGVTTDSNKSGLVADLSSATAVTINSMRMAFQLQRLLETDSRSGTRFTEILRAHFKTVCPDGRLQRSEFLGSTSIPITFSPIAQTSATADGGTPQGNLAATAHAYGEFRFRSAFTEHGYVFILASVRADLNYQQGIDRHWSRKSRYDFYWPTLAHLGEQAVLNKEIFAQGGQPYAAGSGITEGPDDDVFGYQERYAELRYNPSKITGKLRSGVDGSLDVWHLAQNFSDLPTLSSKFIEEDPPLARVLAVTEGEPQVLLDCYLGQTWTRPLPVYSIPGFVDHF